VYIPKAVFVKIPLLMLLTLLKTLAALRRILRSDVSVLKVMKQIVYRLSQLYLLQCLLLDYAIHVSACRIDHQASNLKIIKAKMLINNKFLHKSDCYLHFSKQ